MLSSSEKVDRGTYAQSDPSGLRVISNAAGENLLLRHSHCEKNQRSLCPDNEIDTLLDLMLRFDEAHTGRVRYDSEVRISFGQRGAICGRGADDCYRKTLLRRTCNELGCKITAGNDGEHPAAEPSHSAQHPAVAKHAPRPLIERLHVSRILEQPNHVVHVRCHHIFETSAHVSEDIANSFFNRSGIKTRPEEIN